MTMSFACDVVVHNATKNRAFSARFFVDVVRATLVGSGAKLSGPVEVGIKLVGASGMRTLNRTHRKIDRPTDVLSFPLHTKAIAGYTSLALGDLVLCPEVVAKKAKETGHTVRYQMMWSVVHGVLHLLGHDHERSANKARTMAKLEELILHTLANG